MCFGCILVNGAIFYHFGDGWHGRICSATADDLISCMHIQRRALEETKAVFPRLRERIEGAKAILEGLMVCFLLSVLLDLDGDRSGNGLTWVDLGRRRLLKRMLVQRRQGKRLRMRRVLWVERWKSPLWDTKEEDHDS